MRVAIAYDWLIGMRGGERCLEALLGLYPDAEIFTLLHVPGSVSPLIEDRPIHTSFINRLPRATDLYRYYLPLFPTAIERFPLRGFDLVISLSHCVAKGVRVPKGTPHLCYCFTPMRYLWDLYDAYFAPGRASPGMRAAMSMAAHPLRRWDVESAQRVPAFVAISNYVAGRITRCYGREAAVVYPPVALDRFQPRQTRDDFYLVVSALVPYKRIDIAVEAFGRLDRRLIIVGDGPELPRLRRQASRNVEFRGRLPDEEVADLLERCRALIFPGLEDFGIVPLEAQAAGAPVIAYGLGGVCETVADARRPDSSWPHGPTGLFFMEQNADALVCAIEEFESLTFDAVALRASASRFTLSTFQGGIGAAVDRLMADPSGRLR